MLLSVNPKPPMRNKAATKDFYLNKLGFTQVGSDSYAEYLMVEKDSIQLHFFEFKELDPLQNYGQVYIRVNQIDELYKWVVSTGVKMNHANYLQTKPWGQKEFSLLDPDNNLLTFGESL